jgi:hypothetical protein
MAIDEGRSPPLLNPVLSLTKKPVPEEPAVSGKGEDGIVASRLTKQREILAEQVASLAAARARTVTHGGKLLLSAEMFPDSFAPSWTPKALFDRRLNCRLVAPGPKGYLVEASSAHLTELAAYIRTAQSIEARTAISRVEQIGAYLAPAVLHGRSARELWDEAEEVKGGRLFLVWLAPFIDSAARSSVTEQLSAFETDRIALPTYAGLRLTTPDLFDEPTAQLIYSPGQTTLARAIRRYRNEGNARATVTLTSEGALETFAASGTSVRIDPVRSLAATSPGEGPHPSPPVPTAANQPVIAVVDGGLTANSYQSMEAWRAVPLVPNGHADNVHGNRVTSLVIQGHAWNNNLSLPSLNCRVGTLQAIPKPGAGVRPSPESLIDYMRQIARQYPEAKVWNMSFNAVSPEDDPNIVSYLGHEIASFARDFNVLPVISIGNRSRTNPKNALCAPADCEAGLTVAGRQQDDEGYPAGPCDVSLRGPGPDGMLKPDLSWFSRVRALGGGEPIIGTSYATPLVASLAAHTFANLKDPSPDLVRALLIDKAELETHDHALGWGVPYDSMLPWRCPSGTVTMAWKADLVPGYAYYWNDIPIPAELVKDGKLLGSARLTAILKPLVSESGGPNYFSTRLQVALQYTDRGGKTANLLGSMKEDKAAEQEARTDLAKWHPVRRHARDFSKRGGLSFSGDTMRLHARVFARDLFQYGVSSQRELGEQEVAFVLTLQSTEEGDGIYNSTTQMLRGYVESAVLNQEIDVETDIIG